MLRLLDIVFALIGLTLLLPVILLLLVIGYFDTGSPLFFQQRLGRFQKPFTLVKFRTMSVGTASVASHLVSGAQITKYGAFLRKTKLDELPQLWNVLTGDMSLVGPRPGLENQLALTAARAAQGVFDARPGITGLAQVSGIDMSTPEKLAEVDKQMLRSLSLKSYLTYIVQTATGKGQGDAAKRED